MTLHTPRPLSPAASSRAGFTLIELLIVIAILGRMRAALPTKDNAVVDLRLEVLGLMSKGNWA
mgnify:CR=1 FL=1